MPPSILAERVLTYRLSSVCICTIMRMVTIHYTSYVDLTCECFLPAVSFTVGSDYLTSMLYTQGP
jgi:hypothetical protein